LPTQKKKTKEKKKKKKKPRQAAPDQVLLDFLVDHIRLNSHAGIWIDAKA